MSWFLLLTVTVFVSRDAWDLGINPANLHLALPKKAEQEQGRRNQDLRMPLPLSFIMP